MDAMSVPAVEQPHRVSLLPVFLIVLVDVFGMTLVIPLLAIYAESFHASPLQAMLLVSVYAACQLFAGPIIGPSTREQLDAGIRALDVTLDDAALARLDEIFPGHKPAPEDYAW